MTLVELLVVVSILALLIALLLPAVNAARETGRRTGCAANQTRLGLAFASFDSRLGYLPGWRSCLQLAPGVKTAAGADNRLVSWAVALLPYIERTDVLTAMLDNTMWNDLNPKQGILLTEYLCPSFKPKTQQYAYSVLHYGVNVGTGLNRNDGVLVDGTTAARMSLEDVREGDGLHQTMLVSEATFDGWPGGWGPAWHDPMGGSPMFKNAKALLFGLNGGPVAKVINGPERQLSLPRSKHFGGANLTFCNGSVRFVKDTLPPHVFAHFVTSSTAWNSRAYTPHNSTQANGWLRAASAPPVADEPYQLKESDY